jgi:RecA-superfamily ATPases implicated in signal transduction
MKSNRSSKTRVVTPGSDRCPSGVEGLDDILAGGLARECFYLIQGDPGSGKTTLALQFLLEGLRRGESVFYVTLSETRAELLKVAQSHGWSLEKDSADGIVRGRAAAASGSADNRLSPFGDRAK